ncbi:MAG: rRNA ((1498)-N(3))-methyltransferase [Naasia sp.]|nr:rRNA ((1498)-N(3))-methyltransferase [Naasia sp.]
MAHHYFVDSLAGVRPGALVRIAGAEGRHAATVSRIRVGESVAVGDGGGTVARGLVEAASAAELTVRVDEVVVTPRPERRMVLVQALAKGDRDELAVQAATELGVDRIVPWQAQRSVSRWSGPKAERGRERWQSIVREAVKQSLRPWLPEVVPLAGLADVLALAGTSAVLILEPTAVTGLADAAAAAGDRDLVLVVGPEGGVAPRELEALAAAGGTAVRLGPEVLRTSTAGPAALAALSVLTGRW